MKKEIIRAIVCVIVFFTSILIISAIMNKGNSDMTAEMKKASFPLVSIKAEKDEINCLHGFSEKMEESSQRDTVVCLPEDRRIQLVVDCFSTGVQGMSFEVRSVDGERLVESTEIYDYTKENDRIFASIQVKDLIESETEYSLVILIKLENGNTIRYYTRIIQAPQYPQEEMIAFAKDFSTRTFNKEAARELTKYLESNAEGDNTTFHKVTIHSSFAQITWGDLNINKEMEPDIYLRQIDKEVGVVELSYYVSEQKGKNKVLYKITEYYRLRYGSDRMYLLDFERTMNQIFDPDNPEFSANKINLGITNSDIKMVESEGGKVLAFVQGNRLFSYNITDNKLAVLFSFYDAENWDKRTLYDAHDIQILSIDETGNVRFLVCGYMNRGMHEGGVGAQVYYYNSMLNTIEEEIYIPYLKSYSILKADLDNLAYVNNNNMYYLLIEGTLYSVNLQSKKYEVLANNLNYDSYQVSASKRMVVWESDKKSIGANALTLMDLNSGKVSTIEGGNGKYIKPLGFMGEDLIYGIAHQSDVGKDNTGSLIFPMHQLKIQSNVNSLEDTYEKDGYYVIDAQITDNQINLKRVAKAEDGSSYVIAPDDQIINSEVVTEGENTIEVAAIAVYEKIVQIAVKSTLSTKNVKKLTPKEVLYEGGRELALKEASDLERYYVYAPNGDLFIYEKPSEAVKMAASISGTVVNDDGGYVWKKTIRNLKNQIMKIEETSVTEEKNSVAICLDTMLKTEGILKNTENMLNQGLSIKQILSDNLPDYQVIDLTGVSLEAILYYVNQDLPVMAKLDDGTAVLVIGFNELNTVIMNPTTGTIYKKGMQDSTTWFEENGNRFITYVK